MHRCYSRMRQRPHGNHRSFRLALILARMLAASKLVRAALCLVLIDEVRADKLCTPLTVLLESFSAAWAASFAFI